MLKSKNDELMYNSLCKCFKTDTNKDFIVRVKR